MDRKDHLDLSGPLDLPVRLGILDFLDLLDLLDLLDPSG